jgi:hypothetical protein
MHTHLPKAARLDPEVLSNLDTRTLVGLMLECVEWCIDIEEARREILAPSARKVWNALVAVEIAMVVAAHDRIADEFKSRGYEEHYPWRISKFPSTYGDL